MRHGYLFYLRGGLFGRSVVEVETASVGLVDRLVVRRLLCNRVGHRPVDVNGLHLRVLFADGQLVFDLQQKGRDIN